MDRDPVDEEAEELNELEEEDRRKDQGKHDDLSSSHSNDPFLSSSKDR